MHTQILQETMLPRNGHEYQTGYKNCDHNFTLTRIQDMDQNTVVPSIPINFIIYSKICKYQIFFLIYNIYILIIIFYILFYSRTICSNAHGTAGYPKLPSYKYQCSIKYHNHCCILWIWVSWQIEVSKYHKISLLRTVFYSQVD